MNDQEILNAIEAEEGQAYGYMSSDLAAERSKAMDAYLGLPYGNEIDGRSQVVMSDVADTIEGILPALCKIFAGSDEVVKFTPKGPEDIEAAEQETEYINHVITQRNSWLPTFYAWAKDALLQKNGYVKAYWNEYDTVKHEKYEGLSDDEFALIMQDEEVEPVAHEEMQVLGMDPMTGQQMMVNMHNITVKKKERTGCVKYEAIPPEEVLVSVKCRTVSLKDADFVQHRTRKTISELRAEGFDVPDDIMSYDDASLTDEADSRDLYGEDQNIDGSVDPSQRYITVRETYIKLDVDDDGIAELRRIVVIGDTVYENEITDIIPIACLTPKIMSHRHIGRSMADETMDIQLIKTTVIRNELDSVYLALHGRHAVNADRVNLDDMLTSRPGGVVRVKGDPAGAILPLVNAHMVGQAFPMMEYLDTIKENRTGITKYNQGLDSQSLNKTATGVAKIMSAAQERMLLIARLFAETGVKELFLIVHALTLKHQRKQDVIRLRNQWVPVDPRTWVNRSDMTISVGLGTGDKEQQAMQLQTIAAFMQGLAGPVGIITPKNVYNLGAKLVENAGYRRPDEFVTDPESQQMPEPKPDPKALEAQAKMQLEQAKLQLDQQGKMQNAQMEQAKSQQEMRMKEVEMDHQLRLEAMKAEAQSQLEREKMLLQAELEREKMALQQQTTMFQHQSQKELKEGPEVQQFVSNMLDNLGQALEQTKQEIAEIINQPRQIQRDAQGRAVAVNGRPIQRDERGRMIGF